MLQFIHTVIISRRWANILSLPMLLCLLAGSGLTLPALASGQSRTSLQETNLATALVILKRSTHDGQPVMYELSHIEFESPIAMKVRLTNGQFVTFTRQEIQSVIRYPDLRSTLDSSQHRQVLANKQQELLEAIKQTPVAASYIQPVIHQIKLDLQRLDAGQVRYGGVWQEPQDKHPSPGEQSGLVIAGKQYKSATLSRIDNGDLVITHDAGILRVPLLSAEPSLLKEVWQQPHLFKKLTPVKMLKVNGAPLNKVVLVGIVENSAILLHEGGVVNHPLKELDDVIKQSLAVTNPALAASLTQPMKSNPASEKEVASQLLLTTLPSRTKDDDVYGWLCSEEEKQLWIELCREKLIHDFRMLGYLAFMKREPVIIPGHEGPIPDTEQICSFINNKIAPFNLGYSPTHRCMVLRVIEDETANADSGTLNPVVALFRLPELNARVTAQSDGRSAYAVLEGANGDPVMTVFENEAYHNGSRSVWRNRQGRITLPVADAEEAVRVAKALRLLIYQAGGTESKL